MNKILRLLLSFTLVSSLVGCSTETTSQNSTRIVTTIYPVYDWLCQIIGDEDITVDYLFDNGVDVHSYQATMDDLVEIHDSELFIYVGGESETWVENAVAETSNDDQVIVSLLDALGDNAKIEEIVEGMETHEHEEEHDHEDHDHDEEEAYDEHVWLSLQNAMTFVDMLAEYVADLDPEHRDVYRANADAYINELQKLDDDFQAYVDTAEKNTVLFADRFPFRYFIDDYGLEYYAAFDGCSSDTQASFETVIFLADKVDSLQLNHILVIDGGEHKVANSVLENTTDKNAEILELYSMQAISEDEANTVNYLDMMKSNINVMKEALK